MANGHILFILRDKIFLKEIIESLDKTRFDIQVVTSAVEGIEKALSQQPGVVFLDIKISDIASHQVARYLRNRHETKHMPIIFLADSDTPKQSLFWATELGVSDYLVEPIEEASLQEKIKKYL